MTNDCCVPFSSFVLRAYFVIETPSLPSLRRCYPRSFTFFVGRPAPSIRHSCFVILSVIVIGSITGIPVFDPGRTSRLQHDCLSAAGTNPDHRQFSAG